MRGESCQVVAIMLRVAAALASGRSLRVIVVCSACPAQYSVPEAKVRGKKVRITCKHCRAGIIVDGTRLPEQAGLRMPEQERSALMPSLGVASQSSSGEGNAATSRRAASAASFSAHDDPTLIGRIPHDALEHEGLYAQRALPPAAEAEEPAPAARAADSSLSRSMPKAPRALLEVPERPEDTTLIASPQAMGRRSQASSPSLSVLPVPPPAPRGAPAEVKTLISPGYAASGERRWLARNGWLLLLLTLVLVLALWRLISSGVR
jgi:hypothetical protein